MFCEFSTDTDILLAGIFVVNSNWLNLAKLQWHGNKFLTETYFHAIIAGMVKEA